jgi:hypothetical protein
MTNTHDALIYRRQPSLATFGWRAARMLALGLGVAPCPCRRYTTNVEHSARRNTQ